MSLSPVEQIKERLDLAELVGGYVQLKKAGANLRGLCPFHKEKTPSFFVSPSRQTWHCFGCNRGGDCFTFVQEMEGMPFPEALQMFAQRTGVVLKREPKEKRDARQRLLDANAYAKDFFRVQLEKSGAGGEAMQYLADRGLREGTVKEFELGWAPGQDASLTQYLQKKGFSRKEVEQAGLAFSFRGGTKDKFRGRIMFPIFDRSGRPVGFTGRIFGRDEGEYDPKYLNSPETPVFEKYKILYGFNKARRVINKEGRAILVEGQMDCLMAHQAGTAHAVATSGTALTSHHVRLIRRLAKTLVVAYDADVAGVDAAQRSIELALEEGLSVRVAVVPSGKDPADYIQEDEKQWQRLVADEAQPIVLFTLERLLSRHDAKSAEGKRAVAEEIIPLLARLENAVERSHWVGEVASRLAVREEMLWEELEKHARTAGARKSQRVSPQEKEEKTDAASAPGPLSRQELLEEHLLTLALLSEKQAREELVHEALFSSQILRHLFEILNGLPEAESPFEAVKALQEQSSEEAKPYASRIAFATELLFESLNDPAAELAVCVREIKALKVREELDTLSLELKQAEGTGDAEKVKNLTQAVHDRSAVLSEILSE